MIVELVFGVVAFDTGAIIVRGGGMEGWGVIPWGLLTGSMLTVVVGAVQVVVRAPTTPILTYSVMVLLAVVWWWWRRRQGHGTHLGWAPSMMAVGTVMALIVLFRAVTLTKWSYDSLAYVLIGSLLEADVYHHTVDESLLDDRFIGVGLIHSPANLHGEFVIASATPLVALATLGVAIWILRVGLAGALSGPRINMACIIAAVVIITTDRVLYSAIYVNSHMHVAGAVLLLVGSSWLIATRAVPPSAALIIPMALAIPMLIVTRADGIVIAGLALVAAVLSPALPAHLRVWLIRIFGISALTWYGYVWSQHLWRDLDLSPITPAMASVGIVALVAAPLVRWREVTARHGWILLTAEVVLWLAVMGAAVVQPTLAYSSVKATAINHLLLRGMWGWSVVILAVIIVGGLVYLRAPQLIYLRVVVTWYVPMSLLLAHVRDGAFRVGQGDSLNRSLMHVFIVAVVYAMVLVFTGERRDFSRLRYRRHEYVNDNAAAPPTH